MKNRTLTRIIIILLVFIFITPLLYQYLVFPYISTNLPNEQFLYINTTFFQLFNALQTASVLALIFLVPVRILRHSKRYVTPALPTIPEHRFTRAILRWLLLPFIALVYILMLMHAGFEFFLAFIPLLVVAVCGIKLMRDLGTYQSNSGTILTVWFFFAASLLTFRMGYAIFGDGSQANWTLQVLSSFMEDHRFTYDQTTYGAVHAPLFSAFGVAALGYFFWGVAFLSSRIKRTSHLTKTQITVTVLIPFVLIIIHALTLLMIVRPTLEAKPDLSFLDGIPRECHYPSVLDVNGTPNFIWPDNCERNQQVEALMLKNWYGIEPVQQSVTVTVHGTDTPAPVPFDSIITVAFDYEHVSNCYPIGGPVPIVNERAYDFRDDSFIIITNASPTITSMQLVARHQELGYVPEITIGLRCEANGTDVTDTVTIPITR